MRLKNRDVAPPRKGDAYWFFRTFSVEVDVESLSQSASLRPHNPVDGRVVIARSPEDCGSLSFHFVSSTPMSPPNNPPMIVFKLRSSNSVTLLKSTMGFSRNPTMRDPINAPMAAPRMMESLLDVEIGSVVRFLKCT